MSPGSIRVVLSSVILSILSPQVRGEMPVSWRSNRVWMPGGRPVFLCGARWTASSLLFPWNCSVKINASRNPEVPFIRDKPWSHCCLTEFSIKGTYLNTEPVGGYCWMYNSAVPCSLEIRSPPFVGEETESQEGIGILHLRTQSSLAAVPGTSSLMVSQTVSMNAVILSFRTGDH